MPDNNTYIKGSEGTLAVAVGNAWKPVGCLTSSSYSAVMNMIEKVNMCTGGETVSSPNNLTRSVSIEGEVVDTTAVGGNTIEQSLGELYDLQETQVTSRTPNKWRLSRGAIGYKYFDGFISDISDNFQAGEDATFSATLTVQAKPSETDPLTGG